MEENTLANQVFHDKRNFVTEKYNYIKNILFLVRDMQSQLLWTTQNKYYLSTRFPPAKHLRSNNPSTAEFITASQEIFSGPVSLCKTQPQAHEGPETPAYANVTGFTSAECRPALASQFTTEAAGPDLQPTECKRAAAVLRRIRITTEAAGPDLQPTECKRAAAVVRRIRIKTQYTI